MKFKSGDLVVKIKGHPFVGEVVHDEDDGVYSVESVIFPDLTLFLCEEDLEPAVAKSRDQLALQYISDFLQSMSLRQ